MYRPLVSPSSPTTDAEPDRDLDGDLDMYREPTDDERDLRRRRRSGDEARDEPGLCRRRL